MAGFFVFPYAALPGPANGSLLGDMFFTGIKKTGSTEFRSGL